MKVDKAYQPKIMVIRLPNRSDNCPKISTPTRKPPKYMN